jgi:tRNA/tmRNA/rRNA uracil-C5-methylase (TrmA/RlmC/RlmD family)
MSPSDAPAATVELTLDGITHGGEAVGRLPDGKACFVPYAIPGERVRVAVVEERRRWARARLVEVVEPSPDRVPAPCPYFGPDRCGGCQLQHLAPAAQPALKRRIVTEQLARIGRIADPPVAETVVVAPFGYRTSARFGVAADGRLGFRRAGSHDIQPIAACLLLTREAQDLREEAGDAWEGVEEVVVRASTATGERALVVHPGPGGLPALPPGDAPVAVVGRRDAVALRGEPTITETVGGRTFRVSPTSFFQASAAGAAALSGLVREAAAVSPGDTALDLHAGVGLFAAALAEGGAAVTAVEAHLAAAEDARANLGGDAEVVTADAAAYVGGLVAEHAVRDVVVLDPPRRGAGPDLCRAVAELDPRVVVYVSCDPAALARDAAVLAEEGYELTVAVPVDQFAQTAQIETVATFQPAARLA